MNEKKENSYGWITVMKGVAIFGVFIHHWFVLISPNGDPSVLYTISRKFSSFSGSFVQLFFLLSGFGLYLSYNDQNNVSWKNWANRRINKVLIPYWIIVLLTSLAASVFPEISSHGPEYGYDRSIIGLLSYLLLFRNIYPPAWGLNVTFWFVPVIIGLYVMFPFCIKILNKYGPITLLFIAFILNYASITMFVVFGLFYSTVNHQRDWFVFYTLQFVVGILLAYYTINGSVMISKINNLMLIGIGLVCYAVSVLIKQLWVNGGYYNDIFTTFGSFLIIYCLYRFLEKYELRVLSNLLVVSGQESYMIYLIHFPLIILFGEMMLNSTLMAFLGSSYMIFTGTFFFLLVLSISKLISLSLNKIIARKTYLGYSS